MRTWFRPTLVSLLVLLIYLTEIKVVHKYMSCLFLFLLWYWNSVNREKTRVHSSCWFWLLGSVWDGSRLMFPVIVGWEMFHWSVEFPSPLSIKPSPWISFVCFSLFVVSESSSKQTRTGAMAMLRVSSYRRLFEDGIWGRKGGMNLQSAGLYRAKRSVPEMFKFSKLFFFFFWSVKKIGCISLRNAGWINNIFFC